MLKNEQNPAKSHKDGYLISNNHKKPQYLSLQFSLHYPIPSTKRATVPVPPVHPQL